MAGVNPGGISRSNIGITWGHGWMALLAKDTKLIILCFHAKKLIYHVINKAKMVILWVNIRVRPPPSWNSVFGTTWLRFSSRSRFWARVRNLVGPGPGQLASTSNAAAQANAAHSVAVNDTVDSSESHFATRQFVAVTSVHRFSWTLYPRVSGGRSPNDYNSNRQHWKTVWTKTNLLA